MTTGGISGHRRCSAVSMSPAVASSDPVEQLDRLVEAFHQVNRALPQTVLGREELIAVGGLLIQITDALLTLTDLLGAPAHHYDRTRLLRAGADVTPAKRLPAATNLLRLPGRFRCRLHIRPGASHRPQAAPMDRGTPRKGLTG